MAFRFTGLWRNPDFLKLWAGGTVSGFGSQITFIALPFTAILVLDATPVHMGILAAAGSAPALVLGVAAGVWVDRKKKRPIVIAADYCHAVLLLAIPISAAFHLLRIEYLYLFAVAAGTLGLFRDVASRSMLPNLVTRDQLVEANSKLAIGRSASEVTGPGVGGILVQLFTAPIALIVDAVTFVVSALAIQSIKYPEPKPMARPRGGNFVEEARQGIEVIWRSRVLLAIAGVVSGIAVFNAMFEAGWLLYVSKDLGLEPGTLGLMFSVSSVGLLLGALIADRITRWAGVGRTIVLGVLIVGLSDLATPLAGGSVILIIVLLTIANTFFGLGATIYGVSEVSLRQASTPLSLQGRMNGVMSSLELGLVPVGALIGGVLGQTIGLRPTLFLAAGGELAAILFLIPVWSLRHLPKSSDG